MHTTWFCVQRAHADLSCMLAQVVVYMDQLYVAAGCSLVSEDWL